MRELRNIGIIGLLHRLDVPPIQPVEYFNRYPMGGTAHQGVLQATPFNVKLPGAALVPL